MGSKGLGKGTLRWCSRNLTIHDRGGLWLRRWRVFRGVGRGPRAGDSIRGSVLFTTNFNSPVYAVTRREGSIWLAISLSCCNGRNATFGNGAVESGSSFQRLVELQDF